MIPNNFSFLDKIYYHGYFKWKNWKLIKKINSDVCWECKDDAEKELEDRWINS